MISNALGFYTFADCADFIGECGTQIPRIYTDLMYKNSPADCADYADFIGECGTQIPQICTDVDDKILPQISQMTQIFWFKKLHTDYTEFN